MSKLTSADGQCLCGAVQFTATGIETEYHACHCGTCRHWGGGPALAATVEGLSFTADAALHWYASSDWAERGFCSQCGSSLFYHLKPNNSYVVWIGSFADQSPFVLHGEIYIDAKPPGYAFAGEHPRHTEAEFLASLGMAPEGG